MLAFTNILRALKTGKLQSINTSVERLNRRLRYQLIIFSKNTNQLILFQSQIMSSGSLALIYEVEH